MPDRVLRRAQLPLVAFSAGSLLGGAFFHVLPLATASAGEQLPVFIWLTVGFSAFFLLELFLHSHHCHDASASRPRPRPLAYLILIGDGLHNFLGGLAVAGTFLVDTRLGIATWLAAAAHEVPQELGDFGALLHGGFSKRKALLFNLLSASTFLVGGLVAYAASFRVDVSPLVPFAAGNFIYIAASDLVPEINRHQGVRRDALHFAAFVAGAALLLGLRVWLD